jgi:hypothetical protein
MPGDIPSVFLKACSHSVVIVQILKPLYISQKDLSAVINAEIAFTEQVALKFECFAS